MYQSLISHQNGAKTMSSNLNFKIPQAGDILTLNTISMDPSLNNLQIGKFLVVSIDDSDAKKIGDIESTLINLLVLHMDKDYKHDSWVPSKDDLYDGWNPGSKVTMFYGQMINQDLEAWKLE